MAEKPSEKQMLTFKLNSPRDLLEKLRNDVVLLEDEVTSYRFFNLAVTGYHIIDWIKNNETVSDDTRKAVEEMYKDEYLSICRDLANAIKHWKLDYKSKNISSVKSTQGGYGTGRYGKGLYGNGEEQITMKCRDGREYNILEFARAILRIWDDFFEEHKLR